MKGTGVAVDIKKFTSMILTGIGKAGLPITGVERIQTDKGLYGIETIDNSQFLLKIAKRDAKTETSILELDEKDNKIHEIYEQFANSWKYNNILENYDFDIDWLLGELDMKSYQKLEEYILDYCSRNNELLFQLGFKYAWSLFNECERKNDHH